MSQKPKKKLCWNCEGSVSMQEENCPFCGVYLSPMNISSDPQANLLNPPYQMDKEQESEIPEPPYAESVSETPKLTLEAENKNNELKNHLLVTALLLAGTALLLFALILLFFSRNGVFTLRWNGDLWFIYLALALPMLGYGWLQLQKLDT